MFATRFNWLIVAIVLVIGPVIRHFFNSRHEGKGGPWWTWKWPPAGMIAVAWLSGAGPGGLGPRADKVDVQAAENTVLVRCSMCHRGERSGQASARRPTGSCSIPPRASAATRA